MKNEAAVLEWALQRERETVREFWGDQAAPLSSLLADMLNGTICDPTCAEMLAAEMIDAEPALFEKWGLDRDVAIAAVEALTVTQRLAVVDAVERFWERVGNGESVDREEILQ